MIEGERIYLREIEEDDLTELKFLRNEKRIRDACREYRLLNMINQKDWFERVSRTNNHLNFMISMVEEYEDCDVRVSVGYVGLVHRNELHRAAEASIAIHDEYLGKGYAEEALNLLLKYGFEELNLHKITAEIFAFNDASVKLFEKVGFKHEGTLRDHHFSMGKYWNSEMYSILEDEWREAHGEEDD